MSEKLLKECKLCKCGGSAIFQKEPGSPGYYPPKVRITCQKCGTKSDWLYYANLAGDSLQDQEVKLIKLWNARKDYSETEKLKSEIKDLESELKDTKEVLEYLHITNIKECISEIESLHEQLKKYKEFVKRYPDGHRWCSCGYFEAREKLNL